MSKVRSLDGLASPGEMTILDELVKLENPEVLSEEVELENLRKRVEKRRLAGDTMTMKEWEIRRALILGKDVWTKTTAELRRVEERREKKLETKRRESRKEREKKQNRRTMRVRLNRRLREHEWVVVTWVKRVKGRRQGRWQPRFACFTNLPQAWEFTQSKEVAHLYHTTLGRLFPYPSPVDKASKISYSKQTTQIARSAVPYRQTGGNRQPEYFTRPAKARRKTWSMEDLQYSGHRVQWQNTGGIAKK